MVYIVGITGNICSGKSGCLKFLSSQKYSYGLNYDTLGHTVYSRNLFFLNLVKNIFSPFNQKIFTSNQYEEFNRKELGNLVFQNEKHMQVLNSLIRPEMRKLLKTHFMKLEGNTGILFVEGALIIEAESENLFDEIWMTVASKEEVEKRFLKRIKDDKIREYDKNILEKILKFQMSEEEKKKHCTEIIDTSQDYEVTKLKYTEVYNKLLGKLNLL
jgi:dephospho-CoA kinase